MRLMNKPNIHIISDNFFYHHSGSIYLDGPLLNSNYGSFDMHSIVGYSCPQILGMRLGFSVHKTKIIDLKKSQNCIFLDFCLFIQDISLKCNLKKKICCN